MFYNNVLDQCSCIHWDHVLYVDQLHSDVLGQCSCIHWDHVLYVDQLLDNHHTFCLNVLDQCNHHIQVDDVANYYANRVGHIGDGGLTMPCFMKVCNMSTRRASQGTHLSRTIIYDIGVNKQPSQPTNS